MTFEVTWTAGLESRSFDQSVAWRDLGNQIDVVVVFFLEMSIRYPLFTWNCGNHGCLAEIDLRVAVICRLAFSGTDLWRNLRFLTNIVTENLQGDTGCNGRFCGVFVL